MFCHSAYGLTFSSAWRFPECETSPNDPELTIELEEVPADGLERVTEGWSLAVDGETIRLAHDHIGRFRFIGTDRIETDPGPDVDEAELRQYLLGPVLGLLVHRRGLLVLHASCLSTDGGAVAFLGAVGAGKSTLAAAGVERGHDLVADDVTVVAPNDPPTVLPGPPVLKLNANLPTAPGASLGAADAAKDIRRIDREGGPGRNTLTRLYVLERGAPPAIDRLDPGEATVEVVRHAYVEPLLDALGDRARNLEQSANLAGAVPVARLGTGDDPSSLEAVLSLVEEDLDDAR